MKKLKFQYLQPENTHPNDGIRERYPHLRNVYHKKFSTRQERSFYFLHLIEYKNYPLKLRVARGTGLPDERDDSIKLQKVGSIILEDGSNII